MLFFVLLDTNVNVNANRQRASMDLDRAGMQTLSEEPEDALGLRNAGNRHEEIEDFGGAEADEGPAEGYGDAHLTRAMSVAAAALPRPPVPVPHRELPPLTSHTRDLAHGPAYVLSPSHL